MVLMDLCFREARELIRPLSVKLTDNKTLHSLISDRGSDVDLYCIFSKNKEAPGIKKNSVC
jgi:hypothetical protein